MSDAVDLSLGSKENAPGPRKSLSSSMVGSYFEEQINPKLGIKYPILLDLLLKVSEP